MIPQEYLTTLLSQPKGQFMTARFMLFLPVFLMTACNSVYVKPESLTPNSVVHVEPTGYTMRRAIKEKLRERGYTVVVGNAVASEIVDSGDGDDIDITAYSIPNDAKYAVRVKERKERFAPVWCALNGFWWWRFNVSVADRTTGEEIMSWFGYGCANSSIRKLDKILDSMERK